MTRIRLYTHPLVGECSVIEAESLGAWLLEHLGSAPTVGVQVFAGEPSDENDITGNVERIIANDAPEYVVLQRPGGEALLAIQIAITLFSVITVLMASPPSMPANINRQQQSTNNALGNRENQVRVGQRVEDIYGTVKSIPSLMAPTYNKYINNTKVEVGYYCVSRGYIDVESLKDGDTLLDTITGASAAVYWPFTSPNSGSPVLQIGDSIIDKLLTVVRSNSVDGITLKALNQLQLARGETYTFTPDAGGDIITQDEKKPNVNAILEPGDEITITMPTVTVTKTWPIDSPGGGVLNALGTGDPDFDDPFSEVIPGDVITMTGVVSGSYTVSTKGTGTVTVTPSPSVSAAVPSTVSVNRNYSGVRVVDGVADGFVILVGASWPKEITGTASIDVTSEPPVTEWTDWVELPALSRTEVWVNVVAPQGMYKDDGGLSRAEVSFTTEVEQLDPVSLLPTGLVESLSSDIGGSVTDERAVTVEHATAWTGPCRVRMKRTTQADYDFDGRVSDEIKWVDLYSVTPVDRDHFGNKTTIHTVTQATTRSTAVKQRQLNCIASRLLPKYISGAFTGSFDDTGLHVSGTIHKTSRLVDIVPAVAADPLIGGRDLATEVDMSQIDGVQTQLDAWNAEAGQFNYTFDSDTLSFEETVSAVANAGFCTAYRQSGRIRLALDRKQDSSVAVFTHRNKKPRAETITRRFASDGEHDGVEFVYVDPDTEQSETIKLPADGSARAPKKFEIPGIRSFTQAWFRANREYRKLLGQRVTIETDTTADARALLPHSRVDIVDNTRFKSYDGEVIGQQGLTLTLSREVEFSPGELHSIVLMKRDGSVQSIRCTQGDSARKVVLAQAPAEEIVTSPDPDDGIRTIFSFASDSQRSAMAYLVTEIEPGDGGQYVTVRGLNYSASYYEADTAAVPAKGAVINA